MMMSDAIRVSTLAALFAAQIAISGAAIAQEASCLGQPATIVGTAEDDTLEGTSGDDVIVGLDGNDVIEGRGGNDIICGSAGGDLLKGGPGDDQLSGGTGNDGTLTSIVISAGDGEPIEVTEGEGGLFGKRRQRCHLGRRGH